MRIISAIADLRLRAHLSSAAGRVRPMLFPMLLTGVAAATAWGLARLVPGHTRPIFAPIASIVAMAAGVGRRGKQATELILGIAIGIGVAELLVQLIGRGTWQLGVAVFVGLAVPTALGLPRLVSTQAGVWGVLVVTLPTGHGHPAVDRFIDGLIGASVAIVLAQILFPVDPLLVYRGATRELRTALAAAIEETAEALRERDRAKAEQALDRIDAIDERRLDDAVSLARDVARRAPRRRRERARLLPAASVAHELTSAVADARGLVTGAIRLLDTDGARLDDAAEALEALAEAIRTTDASVQVHAERARAAAQRVLEAGPSMGGAVLAHAVSEIADHAEQTVRARQENEKRLAARPVSGRLRMPFRRRGR